MKILLMILVTLTFSAVSSERNLEAFFENYCYSCHDGDVQKADFDLERAFAQKPLVRNLKKWKQIIHMTQDGEMPPADEKDQPSKSERRKFIIELSQTLRSFDYDKVRNPGTEYSRRLTNVEYEKTVNDLFGTELKLADRLSPDLKSAHSFSNNSQTLFVQTPVLEKFYATAEYAVSQALPKKPVNNDELKRNLKFFLPDDPKTVLYSFAEKAYHAPVSANDFERIIQVYDLSRAQSSQEDAIRKTLEFILSSPRFLFKVEKHNDNERVGQYEMASRLSYFLWGTMPDERLLSLAKQGKLNDSAVLASEVRRMLTHEKSIYLGDSLGAEWLKYEQVGVRNRPDPIDNKLFTDSLYEAMKKESSYFFTFLFKSNRPIEDLVTARYSFLNEELARYYRIGGVSGKHMRPVRLKNKNRGGILSQASILMVTSHPDRTSPVLRGNWILSDLLGTPPPPPPANVGEIDEDEDVPISRRLKQHSNNKKCIGCHSKIDPLGLAMSNFDNLGRYERERISAGRLNDGTVLRDFESLKKYLTTKKLRTLKRNVVERTLSFALGRPLYYYDEPAVRKILKRIDKPKAGFRDMLIAVVQSYPFRYNRIQQEI